MQSQKLPKDYMEKEDMLGNSSLPLIIRLIKFSTSGLCIIKLTDSILFIHKI